MMQSCHGNKSFVEMEVLILKGRFWNSDNYTCAKH